MLQLLLFLLIVSCSLSCIAWSSIFDLVFIVKLSLICFVSRIVIAAVIPILSFISSDNLNSEYSNFTILVLTIICAFLYVVYSTIVIKSLMRSGELIARFTLDALPGEQLAVDISKRDGLISTLDAEVRKRKILKKSLKQASVETSLKILSYEPFLIFSILVIAALIKVFIAEHGVAKFSWQVISSQMIEVLTVSSMLLGSAIFTVIPMINAVASGNNENIKPSYSRFIYKVGAVSWKMALALGVLSMAFMSVFYGFLFGLTQTYLIISYALAVLFIYTITPHRFIAEYAIRNNRSSDLEGLVFLEGRPSIKPGAFDLIIKLKCTSVTKNERDFLEGLVHSLIYKSVAFIPVDNFIVELSPVISEKSSLSIEWKGRIYNYDYTELSKNSIDKFTHKVSKEVIFYMLPYFTYSNVSLAIHAKSIVETQYAYLRNLDSNTKNVIKDMLLRCLNSGFFIGDVGAFSELCISKMEESSESIEDSIIKDFITSEIDQMIASDGGCRVVFVEDKNLLGSLKTTLLELQLKLKSRNLDPLIVVVNNMENENGIDAQLLDSIFIRSDVVPKRLNYFPVARL